MSVCSDKQIEVYLQRYGWTYESLGHNRWVTGWSNHDRTYNLSVTLSDTFVCFEVSPLLDIDIVWEQWPEVLKGLHELNDRCQFVKLLITDQGKVFLSAHSLRAGFDFDQLKTIIGIIAYYADSLYEEVIDLLRNAGFNTHYISPFLT